MRKVWKRILNEYKFEKIKLFLGAFVIKLRYMYVYNFLTKKSF